MAYEKFDWSFFGYKSPTGNKLVQEWFNGLPIEARDVISDAIGGIQAIPNHLWVRPLFDHLDDGISEFRIDSGAISRKFRIYGYFGPSSSRQTYTFLLGADKKRAHQQHEQDEAKKRMKRVERGEVKVHEFDFESGNDEEVQEE
jgi:hypothetical protein